MAKRDADLTSTDKNEVIPSRMFIFHPGVGGGSTLGISDNGVVPSVTSNWSTQFQSYVITEN